MQSQENPVASTQMKFSFSPKINFQMHTVYSDNRDRCSVLEMARAAKMAGFTMIAITDHIELIPELSVWKQYLADIREAGKKMRGLRVFPGIEVSMQKKKIGWAPFMKEKMLVVASCHENQFRPKSTEQYYDMLLKTIRDKRVDIIGHPLRILYEGHLRMFTEHETLTIIHALLQEEKKEHRVAMELNGGDEKRKFTCDREFRHFYYRCREAGVLFSIGSDAHRLKDIARLPYALIQELNIPKEQIFIPTWKK